MMIEIYKVNNSKDIYDICYIRTKVFVVEQLVDIDLEIDEYDKIASHYLIKLNNRAIGTARVINKDGKLKIGRFAILKEYRNLGYGKSLLQYIIDDLKSLGCQNVSLAAQLSAKDFYKNFGFKEIGSSFIEANIEHIEMEYIIQQ